MPSVDGTPTGADIYGITHGDGGAKDLMTGGAGNDKLQGSAAFNGYYGGAGNDTFIITAKTTALAHEGASLAYSDQAFYASDFSGAGGWSATDNDFLSFTGFGVGSHIDLVKTGTSGTAGAVLYYYTITDGVTGDVHNFMINSLNGKALGATDYGFYNSVGGSPT